MLRKILRQHQIVDTLTVPNKRLDKANLLLRILKTEKIKVRYMPKLLEVEIRHRFLDKFEMTGEEELKLYQANERLKDDEATKEDYELLHKFADKSLDPKLMAALYSAIIVSPKMKEEEVENWIKDFTDDDLASLQMLLSKYLFISETEIRNLKNSSARQPSPISTQSSSSTKEDSASIGKLKKRRLNSSRSSAKSTSSMKKYSKAE